MGWKIVLPTATLALVALAMPARGQALYWLDTNFGAPTIQRADANGVTMASIPLAAGTLPDGLATGANGKVYWAEAAWSGARVVGATSALGSVTPIVTGGSVFRGIAVDETNQRLVWTSSNLAAAPKIHRSALDGSAATVLVTLSAVANPRGIAVDGVAGHLYWADFGLDAIFRSNLDGSGAGPWLSFPVGTGPWGVAVDAGAQRVYWTEYGTGLLRRATTSANGVTTLVSGLAQPTYLALDVAGGGIYWAEGGAGNQKIRRSGLGGSGVVTLPAPLTTYGGLAFQPGATVSRPAIEAPPAEFALERVWPNPASGPVHVAFALPRDAEVRLGVYDLQGREVAVLARGALPAGRHEQQWDARGAGMPAAAGVYFVRLTAGGRTWSRRVFVAS